MKKHCAILKIEDGFHPITKNKFKKNKSISVQKDDKSLLLKKVTVCNDNLYS